MAIKVGGTSIISDDKNISNVGIVTIKGQSSGKLEIGDNVGIGMTATGDGNVSISGTLTAFDINLPLKIEGFSPVDNATNVPFDTALSIYFNKSVGYGTTGFVEFKINNPVTGSGQTSRIFVGSGSTMTQLTGANRELQLFPVDNFPKSTAGSAITIYPVISKDFINDPEFLGINTSTSSLTYKFEVEQVGLGESYQGGYLVCVASGVQWIVAPIEAERSVSWESRNDAVTAASNLTGCAGWFIPSHSQLINPGYQCRTYWDSYSLTFYWSTTVYSGSDPFTFRVGVVNFNTGATPQCRFSTFGLNPSCARAFRCVTF